MAITSTFYTGAVDNIDWAKGSGRLGFSYVAHGPGDCKVTTVSTGTRTVRVATGAISGGGVTDVIDATVDVTLPNVTSGSQWFMIVARRVWQTTNATTFTYIAGTSTRQLPSRTANPGVQDDQPLALVRITAGQTLPQEIVDLRVIGSNNGVMVGFDALCLQYLGDVGTVVRIGGSDWLRELNSSGAPIWTEQAPIHPFPDVPGTYSIVASGTVKTNGNGDATLQLPYGGFPTALVGAFIQDAGSNLNLGQLSFRFNPSGSLKTAVAFRAIGNSGALANFETRVYVVAVGR